MKPVYWIQKQAPDGGWCDNLGLGTVNTLPRAVTELNNWRAHEPKAVFRLVCRVDVEIVPGDSILKVGAL